jgi:lipid-A-disaccharide synthase
MANIIAGERIVPELIQDNATWENIYNEMKIILENKERLHTMKEKLRGVKLKLGEKGASERAAGIIINELQKV